MKPLSPHRAGISMAASWSWGASLGVGVAVMHTAGVQAFAVWALFNILAIPFFGALYTKLPSYKYIIELRPMIVFMFLLQGFAILINQQLLFEGLTGGVDIEISPLLSTAPATIVSVVVALLLVTFINRTLLAGSLFTDYGQYALQLGGVALLLAVAAYSSGGAVAQSVGTSTLSDVQWAVWVGLGLLVGPSMDAMQFQRIEQVCPAHRFRAAVYGGGFFGAYLALVGLAALFIQPDAVLVTFTFMVVVLSITTSTVDSASAAMHRLAPRKIAVGVGASVALGWPLLTSVGVTSIFTVYSSGRVFVVSGVLLYLLALWWRGQDIRSYTGREDPGTREKTAKATGSWI